jgi:ATP-binding protein involved in chromosome partitioning
VFGRGGGAALAEELGVDLLGEIPLDARLREQADLGVPLVLADPDADSSRAIIAVAEAIAARKRATRALPVIS